MISKSKLESLIEAGDVSISYAFARLGQDEPEYLGDEAVVPADQSKRSTLMFNQNFFANRLMLTLGPVVMTHDPRHARKRPRFKGRRGYTDIRETDNRIVIEPHETISVATVERISVQGRHGALIIPRLRNVDAGLIYTPSYIDPYWDGILQALSLLSVLLVVGCVTMGQATTGDTHEILRTRNLHVVDGAGTSRIVLAVEEGGSSGLVVNDASGKPRAMVGLTPDGSPVVRLSDPEGNLRATLLVAADAEPSLLLLDGDGQVRLRATTVEGQPGVALIDRTGEERIEIASLDGGENGMALNGAGGTLQGAFGTAELLRMLTDEVRPRGAAGVALFDRAGRVLPGRPEDY